MMEPELVTCQGCGDLVPMNHSVTLENGRGRCHEECVCAHCGNPIFRLDARWSTEDSVFLMGKHLHPDCAEKFRKCYESYLDDQASETELP